MSVEQTDRAFQRALREQLARNELTFAHAPIGQAIVELDGSWRQVNSALLQMLEYDEADLLAMTFQDITHPEDLDLDLGLLQQTLDGEITSYQMEKRYFTRTGRTVWALLSVALVRDEDDQPLYFISQILDITAHKKQVQALQDFTAMLAHDLRTPAAVIAGFAQLLSTGPYDDEVTSIARRIERASTTIVDLLENALTTESIDSGRLTARPTAVDVRDAVTTAVQAALSAAEMNEQQLEVDTSGLVPAVAWVDPVHLEQVMTNVIGNARKYGGSPTGAWRSSSRTTAPGCPCASCRSSSSATAGPRRPARASSAGRAWGSTSSGTCSPPTTPPSTTRSRPSGVLGSG